MRYCAMYLFDDAVNKVSSKHDKILTVIRIWMGGSGIHYSLKF